MEMTWLKKPCFFPNREEALSILSSCAQGRDESICIGTKSRNLGDALILTSVIKAIHSQYPQLNIYTFPRAFNPVVFYRNPGVKRVQYFPQAVYGDDCNWGNGHLIQVKELFFEVPVDRHPRPVLFLAPREISWAEQKGENLKNGKPLCILHASGATWKNLLPRENWTQIVKKWKHQFTFLQVGMRGDLPIPGAETHFLPQDFWKARELFALMSQASAFIGIDSGPMHVARAFEVPSLIFIRSGNLNQIFENRRQYPYFCAQNRLFCNLYEENLHLSLEGVDQVRILREVDDFFHSL